MDSIEIINECEMPYHVMVQYLRTKYGDVKYDYFKDDISYIKDRRNSRTAEGLYCHHIDEDKGSNLANDNIAKMTPFEWQRKERLVYCNLIEHLILHLKIIVLRQRDKLYSNPSVEREFGHLLHGVWFICKDLHDIYFEKVEEKWKLSSLTQIGENYEDFISVLASFITYVERQIPIEERHVKCFKKDDIITIQEKDYKVLGVTSDFKYLELEAEEKKVKYKLSSLERFLSIRDAFELLLIKLFWNTAFSNGIDIYRNIKKIDCNCDSIQKMVRGFEKDFLGYGFPYFSDLRLDRDEFGASSIDEYISNAFPSYCLGNVDLSNTIPCMWKGEVPLRKVKNGNVFFVVRIEACFVIKKGEEAFVRPRKSDGFNIVSYDEPQRKNRNNEPLLWDDNYNFMQHPTKIVDTSFWLSKDNKYSSQYIDKNGEIKPSTMKLTLTYDDLILFDQRYEISYLKYLDGCYFVPKNKRNKNQISVLFEMMAKLLRL